MIQKVRVKEDVPAADTVSADLLHKIRQLGICSIREIRTAKVFRLEGVDASGAERLLSSLLAECVTQSATINAPILNGTTTIEVAYKPGVMNPEVASILKAAEDLKVPLAAADTSIEYHFDGDVSADDLELISRRLLVNATTQHVVKKGPETLVIAGTSGKVCIVPLCQADDAALLALSADKLFLNLEEMRVIQTHFRELGRDPTDGELETIAQTWSEHCAHKTFKAKVRCDGRFEDSFLALFRKTAEGFEHVVSCFDDNSGVIDFYDGYAICAKVETHNSPSALAPYGGAATGSGGVFRDILGTGQGAKVILSTDMFCLGPPDLKPEAVPPGCLHPRYILTEVVRGVGDYGNRMGIPTANGSFHFHPDFRAKPTVIVGAYGLIPKDRAKKGVPHPGDAVIAIGGRTGRDGIHGATFSSGEMTERTANVNASAVQIGNAIEEKRMGDALLACRDAGLIRAVTDCGAGGFSSAIGELGSKTGVRIELERAPLKYAGLAPWEIWISESQERMVLAVAQHDVEQALAICAALNVEATVLGEFTDSQRLFVSYAGQTVCDLEMDFLHRGLPQRTIDIVMNQHTPEDVQVPEPRDWTETLCQVLGHLNTCSKRAVTTRYDHGVQGTNALPPYAGVYGDAPMDAVVLRPLPDKPYGMIVAHGLNPVLNTIHACWGTHWAIAEALANYVAVGGDLREAALIDNFIWPFPEERTLHSLYMSVHACLEAAREYGLPFVSGKDSLSGTYREPSGSKIRIPPVLCASVFGRIPDVAKTVSADFKSTSSAIVFIGELQPERMAGSVYYALNRRSGYRLPRVDLSRQSKIFAAVHEWISRGHIRACHDVSEGGIAVTLAEMCFGGDCGADIDLTRLGDVRPDSLLFNEMAGSFICEVAEADVHLLRAEGVPVTVIGRTTVDKRLQVAQRKERLFQVDLARLKEAWLAPFKEVFP